MNKEEWIKQLQDRMADYQEPCAAGLPQPLWLP